MPLDLNDLEPRIIEIMAAQNPAMVEELDAKQLETYKPTSADYHHTMELIHAMEERSVIAKGHVREAVLARIKVQVAYEHGLHMKEIKPLFRWPCWYEWLALSAMAIFIIGVVS